MSNLKALKAAVTLHHVAVLLECRPSTFAHLLYKRPETAKYQTFEIPKRFGGVRQIAAPVLELKRLQERLANLLQDCVEEIHMAQGRNDDGPCPDRIAHGFRRCRSIVTNARQHRNKRFVFNLDLEDFFGSINFGRVRGFFIKDKNFSLGADAATVLAQLACYKQALPQGSPCSPVISNLIAHILDVHLAGLAARYRCTYTRYADDLTFSTNKREFPTQIAQLAEGDGNKWIPGKELSKLILTSGFMINAKKTRMQYRDSRQEVTGLVVNSKINTKREYRHTVRAMVDRLLRTGSFDFELLTEDAAGIKIKSSFPGNIQQLHGMLGFIDDVDFSNKILGFKHAANSPTKQHVISKGPEKDLNGTCHTYRRFLFYKEFYAATVPTIIFEGKTDRVYLTLAMRKLAAEFPRLASKDESGKTGLNIRCYKNLDKKETTRTSNILGFSGGSADLNYLINTYKSEARHFKAAGMQQPIIVFIDNDDGAISIYNSIRKITKAEPDKNAPFIHVFGNLYVVATPMLDKGKSMIEDFFDEATLAWKLNGKTFDSGKKINTDLHYGKAQFANKVVIPNADKIDFSGFKPILERLIAVIHTHAKTVAAHGTTGSVAGAS